MQQNWRPSCSLTALRARAQLYADIRAFFAARDVMEVQTALLASHTVTEPNIDSLEVGGHGFLQTSPEYQMKRLLAAGAPAIYSLGPVFRAGELGRIHNPEFTLLEWYQPGYDDVALMHEVSELVDLVLGPDDYHHHRYATLVGDLNRPADELDLALVDALEALGPGRHFITHFPADQAALARLHADEPESAARFELVVDGVEIANGYHELTDSDEQRRRFARDIEQRRLAGKVELSPDERLLAALDAGLPDCAGVALGLDRLLMLQQGAESLAAVLPFPADRA
jgi:elongation factor P--(R)-beta-lysine ligase